MNLNLTRQSLGGAFVLFTLLLGLFWVRHLCAPLPVEAAVLNPMPLGKLIDVAARGIEWVHSSASLVFVYMTAIRVTRLVVRNLVYQVRTHAFLPLMAVAGFGIFLRDGNTAAVIAVYLLVRGSDYFASTFRRRARAGDLFGGGLMFGLAPLFYAPAAICLIMVLVAMPIYKRNLRETALALVGALLPAFVWFYVVWALGVGFVWPDMGYVLPEMDIMRMVVAGLVAATMLASLVSFVRDARRIRTRAYRIHLYMICFMAVAFAGCRSVGDLPMVAVPVGVVAASWFSRHEGVVPTLAYVLTLAAAIFVNIWEIYLNS